MSSSDPSIYEEFRIVDDDKLKKQDTLDEIAFNSTTRDIIVVSVLFMITYSITLKQIHRYLHLKEFAARDPDERVIRTVSSYVCALSLTIAVFFVVTLPLSMISNELLLVTQYNITSSWYLQWLSTELFAVIWKCLSICSIVSLFVLLPFCYFLLESEARTTSTVLVSRDGSSQTVVESRKTHEQDFRDRYVNYVQHLCSRFFQTLVIFTLFFAILALLTVIFSKIFGQDTDFTGIPVAFHEGYTFLSVCLLLFSAPLGFLKTFEKVQELLENPTYLPKRGNESLVQIQLDTLYRKLESSYTCDFERMQIMDEIRMLEAKMITLRKRVSFWKKVLYPIALILLLALPVISVLICSYHIFELIFQEQSRVFMQREVARPVSGWNLFSAIRLGFFKIMGLAFGKKQSGIRLGQHSLSFFGPVGTIVESALVPYLYASSMFGFYTLPMVKELKPALGDTSLQSIIVNCVITLTMSSALPLLCRTLDLVEPHDTINPSRRGSAIVDENLQLVLGLNILFALSNTVTLVIYLNKNFVCLYRAFRSHFWHDGQSSVHQASPGHGATSPLLGSPVAIKSSSQVSRRLSLGAETDCTSDINDPLVPTAMTSSVASLKFD